MEFVFNKSIVFNDLDIEKYQTEYNALRLLYLHICLLVPVIFYKCLRIKYKDCNKGLLIILSSILLLSPYFRAYAIWPSEINLGLLFLLSSIYFFLKLQEEKKINKKCLLIFFNVLFFALTAYCRPIYSLISIYFFYKIFSKFKFSNELYIFIISCIVLASPAFYYFFVLDQYPFTVYQNFFYKIVQTSPRTYLSSKLSMSGLLCGYPIPGGATKSNSICNSPAATFFPHLSRLPIGIH